jgi:hypothetical protein
MRNPFKRSSSPEYTTGPRPSSNKLIIVAGVITFLVIIIVMFESVVVKAAATPTNTAANSTTKLNKTLVGCAYMVNYKVNSKL